MVELQFGLPRCLYTYPARETAEFASRSKREERRVSIMGLLFRSLAVASLVVLSTGAFAHNFPCSAFRKNLFGSWSALRLVTIQGPEGSISLRRGRTFRLGEYYKGVNVAALLEQDCRR
jgi:hypothetical protein